MRGSKCFLVLFLEHTESLTPVGNHKLVPAVWLLSDTCPAKEICRNELHGVWQPSIVDQEISFWNADMWE